MNFTAYPAPVLFLPSSTSPSPSYPTVSAPYEDYGTGPPSLCCYNTTFCDNFFGFACWRHLILSKFQNQSCTFSSQPGQKCESATLFNTNMHLFLWLGDCIIVTSTDKSYTKYLNKNNYVTVWFIVGINIEILPHDQCCQVPIVEDTGLQWTPIQCINLSQSTQHEAEEEEAGRGEGW